MGNAQKLINLTIKYLYIRYYDSPLRENFRVCDAPMDDKMRDLVSRAYYEKTKKHLGLSSVSWSSMGVNEYKRYQDAIDYLIKASGEDCLKIEFDYLNWGKTDPKDIIYCCKSNM